MLISASSTEVDSLTMSLQEQNTDKFTLQAARGASDVNDCTIENKVKVFRVKDDSQKHNGTRCEHRSANFCHLVCEQVNSIYGCKRTSCVAEAAVPAVSCATAALGPLLRSQ